jgi:uncharacterized protein YndB with AHSA1/START domain
VKWLPPYGFTGKLHQLEARVGGEYLELVPNERIRNTDRFDDPNLPGEMVTTVTLKAVSCGTEVDIVQEGLPEVIPPADCYLGWRPQLIYAPRTPLAAIRGACCTVSGPINRLALEGA